MRQIRRAFTILVLAMLALYAGDFLSARYRIPGNRQTLDTVQVQTLWAIKQKDGRLDYEPGDFGPQTCIRSLFPQLGYTPCWYLTKHRNKIVTIGFLIPPAPEHAAAGRPL